MSENVRVLRDLHARMTRIGEALADGDHEFVSVAVDDLAADVWRLIEAEEGSE